MFVQLSRRLVQPNATGVLTSPRRVVVLQFHTDPKKELTTTDKQKHPADLQLNTLLHDVHMYRNVSKDLIKEKWHEAYSFYAQFTHMDEIRVAQDKVLAIQEELQKTQQQRSDRLNELNAVRKQIKQLDAEKSDCSKSDIRYLELVRTEIKANQREAELLAAYQHEDQRERNLFTHLTAAVKSSHEKEKIYTYTVKYWSIIGSILSVVLGALGMAINYHYREQTYKTVADKYTAQVVQIESHIKQLHGDLDRLQHEIKASRIVHQRAVDAALKASRVTASGGQAAESWSYYLYRKTASGIRWFYPSATTAK